MNSIIRSVVLLCLFVVTGARRRVSQSLFFPPSQASEYPVINHTRRVLVASSPNDHRVTDLPGLTASLEQYAGHLVIDSESQSTIFYWLFNAASNAETAPLIVWMNGGPGCSSMDGLFLELGPLRLQDDSVVINPHSWHNAGNLLFIDQPVGTGLSFTRRSTAYPKNDAEVNRDLYKALLAFVTLHDNYVSTSGSRRISREIYLTGESHAGHYIPSFAAYVIKKNEEAASNGGIVLHIAGLAIGNGWIDPYHQYDVSDYAHGHGLISSGQRNALKKKESQCQRELDRKIYRSGTCFSLLDDVVAASGAGTSGRVEMYDSRVYTKPGTERFPIGHTAVEKYLNRDDVRSAIHAAATPHRYAECTDPPYNALAHQDGLGVMSELAVVLDSNIRVLMFSGQYDIICHHLGTEKALSMLNWSGRDGWLAAGTSIWAVDDHPAGYLKEFRSLQFLVVLDAGHMVPMSRPHEALNMISRFVNSQSFKNGNSKLSTIVQPEPYCPTVSVPVVAETGARFNVDDSIAAPELVEHVVDGREATIQINYAKGVAIVIEPQYRVLLVPTHASAVLIPSLLTGVVNSITLFGWNPSTSRFSSDSTSVDVVLGCGAIDGRRPCCGHGKCMQDGTCECHGEASGNICESNAPCVLYDSSLLNTLKYTPSDDVISIDSYCQSSHLKGKECSVPMQFDISSVDASKTPSYFTSLLHLLRDDLSNGCTDCKSLIRDLRVDLPSASQSLTKVHFVVSGERKQVQTATYALITQSYFNSSPLVQTSLLGSILRSHIKISDSVSGRLSSSEVYNVNQNNSGYIDWLSSPSMIVLVVVGVYVANLAYRKYISGKNISAFRSDTKK